MARRIETAVVLIAGAMIAASGVQAQTPSALPDGQRTNGEQTLATLGWLDKAASPSLVQVLTADGKLAARGVILSNDGFFLTKASEAPTSSTFTVAWPDGSQCQARRVHTDRDLDLLLAKAPRTTGTAITWKASTALAPGDWIVATTMPRDRGCSLRLGVVSARRRPITGYGVAMGIQMNDTSINKGVLIVEVASESPAEAAGLLQDDLLMALDDEPITRAGQVKQLISQFHAGEEVRLRVRRGKAESDFRVRLASKSKVLANWYGEDYANSGVSLRTDNFPEVIQHEIPLQPNDMGSPLLDLEGNALGLNISRVDRVTTFALPMEQFISKARQWMQEDRHTAARAK